MQSIDAQGSTFHYEGGIWLPEAQVQGRKVAAYVQANTAPINQVDMNRLEVRASNRLQEAIWDRLPENLQLLGNKPLFVFVPEVDRFQTAMDETSIFVEGHADKLSLSGKTVTFVFLSADENIPEVDLPYSSGGRQAYLYGAYEGENEEILIVIKMARYVSTTYSLNEYQMVWEGIFGGLQSLSGLGLMDPQIYMERYMYDSQYDDQWRGRGRNRTPMIYLVAVAPFRSELLAGNIDEYYRDMQMQGWVPEEYAAQQTIGK